MNLKKLIGTAGSLMLLGLGACNNTITSDPSDNNPIYKFAYSNPQGPAPSVTISQLVIKVERPNILAKEYPGEVDKAGVYHAKAWGEMSDDDLRMTPHPGLVHSDEIPINVSDGSRTYPSKVKVDNLGIFGRKRVTTPYDNWLGHMVAVVISPDEREKFPNVSIASTFKSTPLPKRTDLVQSDVSAPDSKESGVGNRKYEGTQTASVIEPYRPVGSNNVISQIVNAKNQTPLPDAQEFSLEGTAKASFEEPVIVAEKTDKNGYFIAKITKKDWTVSHIAAKYGADWKVILDFNKMTQEQAKNLKVGNEIKVPNKYLVRQISEIVPLDQRGDLISMGKNYTIEQPKHSIDVALNNLSPYIPFPLYVISYTNDNSEVAANNANAPIYNAFEFTSVNKAGKSDRTLDGRIFGLEKNYEPTNIEIANDNEVYRRTEHIQGMNFDTLLNQYGSKVGISQDVFKNGQVRYRIRNVEGTPGVWIAEKEANKLLQIYATNTKVA